MDTRVAVMEEEGLETVAATIRVFIVEEEEAGGGAALSVSLSFRKLMERCRHREEVEPVKNVHFYLFFGV